MGGCIGKLSSGGRQAQPRADRKMAGTQAEVGVAERHAGPIGARRDAKGAQAQAVGTDIRHRSCEALAQGKTTGAGMEVEVRKADFKHVAPLNSLAEDPAEEVASDGRRPQLERLRALLTGPKLEESERGQIGRAFRSLNRPIFRLLDLAAAARTHDDASYAWPDPLVALLLEVYHECKTGQLLDAPKCEDLVHSMLVDTCHGVPQRTLLGMVRRLQGGDEPGPRYAHHLLVALADAAARETLFDAFMLCDRLQALGKSTRADRDAWRASVIEGVLRPDEHNASLRGTVRQAGRFLLSAMKHLVPDALRLWLPDILRTMDARLSGLSPQQRAGMAGFAAGLALVNRQDRSTQVAVTEVELAVLENTLRAHVAALVPAVPVAESKTRSSSHSSSQTKAASSVPRLERAGGPGAGDLVFAMLHGLACGNGGSAFEMSEVPAGALAKLTQVDRRMDGDAYLKTSRKPDAADWRVVLSNLLLAKEPSEKAVEVARKELGEEAYGQTLRQISHYLSIPDWAR